MPFTIKSPKFSFLEFDVNHEVCNDNNENYYPIPALDFGIKAQIKITSENLTSEKLYIGICDSNCNIIIDNDTEILPIYHNYKFEQEPIIDDIFDFCEDDELNILKDVTFDEIPYPIIPTGSTWELNIPPLPQATPSRAFFILATKDVVRYYIITNETSVTIPYENVFTSPNLDVIIQKIRYSAIESIMRNRIRNAINDGFGIDTGTTATNTGTSVQILNMPEGIGFGYDNLVANINQPPVPAILNFFLDNLVWVPTEQKMFWINQQRYIDTFTNGNVASLYVNEVDLTGKEGQRSKISVTINNTNAFIIRVRVALKDNGWFLAPSVWYDIPANTTETVIHTHMLPPHHSNSNLPFDTAGQIELLFDDNGLNQLRNNDLTFSVDDIKIEIDNVINIISSNNNVGYLPIPIAIYTRKELFEHISEQLEYIIDSCEFSTCKDLPNIEFTHETGINTATNIKNIYIIDLKKYWNSGYIDFPNIEIPDYIDCFKYCILDENKNNLACSNDFKKDDECFATTLKYSNKENSNDFVYPTEDITNAIRLPLFLHSANYPTEEKIYKQADGTYRRVSSQIEKEYEGSTDYLPEWMHDKIIIALKHDKILFTSDRNKLINEEMMQQGNYEVEWKEEVDIVAKAKFKVRKLFDGNNSNCNTENDCN